jgi:CspA family cold shock protein
MMTGRHLGTPRTRDRSADAHLFRRTGERPRAVGRRVGVVSWFDPRRGYGFIAGRGDRSYVFVHQEAIDHSGLSGLLQGQVVEFELVPWVGDHTMAANLRLVAAVSD